MVSVPHDKLTMEFMDFMGRINADVERVGMNTEPVPESSACALNLFLFVCLLTFF
jgi:hypothetical protein